ncbi:zinc finger protein 37-like [Ochlerotatus camptorhynchus]|uniref:zinc finger protein 37-like n=1 Tax=Ochlerotatus camptorhynchus TaxID=644619 RepID=UPI0031D89523
MGRRKARMCRLCLSTTTVLRSIFTIFRNYNLVFIIRDFIKLQVKEDDKLPKLICKSCAVKLIRVRETFTLFIESDRKLREKLSDVDTELTDVVDELRQDRKRKYTKRTDFDVDDNGDVDGDDYNKSEESIKKEVTDRSGSGEQTVDNHSIEFSEVKEEVRVSDEEDDLPLKTLTGVANDSILSAVVKYEEKPPLIDECKQEDKRDLPVLADNGETVDRKDDFDDSNFDDPVAQSSIHSDDDSEYEAPKKRTRASCRVKKKKEAVSKAKPKRTYTRRKQTVKVEIDSEVEDEEDVDDEDGDKTFEVGTELKHDHKNIELIVSEDEVKAKKKRGRQKGTKVSKDPATPRRKPGAPKKLPERTEPVPTMYDFKCYICNSDSLGSKKALIEHFATHVDKVPYTCKECVMETVVITRVRGLNSHMKMHAQPVKCDYCDRRYSNAAGKYYHTQVFHLGGGAPCLVNCEVCGKTCGSQNALKSHMKYHTTSLKCSKCDMVFNHPNKRRNHERLHDENRGYECVVCKKVLQTIESYDVHLKKHSQERSYLCNLCQKKFNTSSNLILHLKVHAKNDNYRPAKSWIEHYTILSRDPMHFKCNHCDRYNTDKVNNMISHLQAHFKEYECDQCHHKFATAKQLRAHYTTHTGDKPEKCKYCDKVFSTKNNLRIHLKATHPEWIPQRQQTPSTSNTPTTKPVPNQTASPTIVTLASTDAPPQASTTPNSDIFDGSPVNSNSGFGIQTQQQVQMQLPTQPAMTGLNILRS